MKIEQNQRIVLAHWTYNREEWKNFIRWDKMHRSRFRYLVHYFFGKKQTTIPEITITDQKIWIDDAVESFSDINRHIKRIDIRDEGKLNVLEITYSIFNNGTTSFDEILIPIPKGKLKEAIQVQENLVNQSSDK